MYGVLGSIHKYGRLLGEQICTGCSCLLAKNTGASWAGFCEQNPICTRVLVSWVLVSLSYMGASWAGVLRANMYGVLVSSRKYCTGASWAGFCEQNPICTGVLVSLSYMGASWAVFCEQHPNMYGVLVSSHKYGRLLGWRSASKYVRGPRV